MMNFVTVLIWTEWFCLRSLQVIPLYWNMNVRLVVPEYWSGQVRETAALTRRAIRGKQGPKRHTGAGNALKWVSESIQFHIVANSIMLICKVNSIRHSFIKESECCVKKTTIVYGSWCDIGDWKCSTLVAIIPLKVYLEVRETTDRFTWSISSTKLWCLTNMIMDKCKEKSQNGKM